MKFKGKTELGNASKDIRKIIDFNIKDSIENLKDDYEYSDEIVDGLSYTVFVTHTEKTIWKGNRTIFVKSYCKEVDAMIDDGTLDFDELGFLLYLPSKYTTYEDNYLKINGELAGKNEIIKDYTENSKQPISRNSLLRRFKSLEAKNFIMLDSHPNDKRKTTCYLSPMIFYKGKYMDNEAKKALISTLHEIYNQLKLSVEKGELDIKLNKKFERMTDSEILNMCAKYINQHEEKSCK